MIWQSNLGWIYWSNERTYLMVETKKILKYIFIIKNIKKIKKNYIEVKNINKLKIEISNVNLLEIKEICKDSKKIYKSFYERIVDDNNLNLNIISWAMNIENEKVERYDNNFRVNFYDSYWERDRKIIFFIKTIKIEKKKNIIKIKYEIKDSFLVYFFINEYYELYEYSEKIEIKIGENLVKWNEKKRKNISIILNEIIKNKECWIISRSYINYNIGIWYKNVDLIKTEIN